MKVLGAESGISLATGYRYLHEGIAVLAAAAPGCAARCWPPAPPGTPMSPWRAR